MMMLRRDISICTGCCIVTRSRTVFDEDSTKKIGANVSTPLKLMAAFHFDFAQSKPRESLEDLPWTDLRGVHWASGGLGSSGVFLLAFSDGVVVAKQGSISFPGLESLDLFAIDDISMQQSMTFPLSFLSFSNLLQRGVVLCSLRQEAWHSMPENKTPRRA